MRPSLAAHLLAIRGGCRESSLQAACRLAEALVRRRGSQQLGRGVGRRPGRPGAPIRAVRRPPTPTAPQPPRDAPNPAAFALASRCPQNGTSAQYTISGRSSYSDSGWPCTTRALTIWQLLELFHSGSHFPPPFAALE